MAGLAITPYHDLGAVKITCTDIELDTPVTLQRDGCNLVIDSTVRDAHDNFIFWDFHAPIGAPLNYKLQLEDQEETGTAILLSEGGFLSDQTRCLPVLYDLDIASYKYNIIDTVTPTLGGKYPFIRRNGYQKYRSFNLSGLISYHAEEVMQAGEEAPDDHYKDTFLSQFEADYSGVRALMTDTDYERIKERQYRESVINFLQDGQVKLFRTLEESNIFVRLTNVTLTPKKELGRMIYTFSCVAVECMATSEDNYDKYCYGTKKKEGDAE